MGAEANCTATFRGKSAEGEARLETDVLQFRGGGVKLSIRFKEVEKVVACEGVLSVTFRGDTAAFALGAASAKWADKIRNPPTRLTKIGVKPTWRVSAVGIEDEGFLSELESAVAHLSIGRTISDCDAIFFGATKEAQLSRLSTLKRSLKPDGALWIVRPK